MNFTVIPPVEQSDLLMRFTRPGSQGIAWVKTAGPRGLNTLSTVDGHRHETGPKNPALEDLNCGPLVSLDVTYLTAVAL